MSVLAIAGLCIIVGFWTLLVGTIWTQIVVTRRRARRRDEPVHSISWIEFVPIVLVATAATFLLNQRHDGLGYQIVGGLHLVLILAIAVVAFHRRGKRIE